MLGSLLLLLAAAATTTHTHTLVCVCVAVAAAVAVVGQAPLGRSAVGIVCLWVRVGVHCGYNIYIYTPTVYTHTNEQTDDPPVEISI